MAPRLRCALPFVLALLCLIQAEARQPPPPSASSAARSPRNANYTIDVRLDHAARTLNGRATIEWRNISARSTGELQFHLYWNAWRNAESTWMRERSLGGSTTRTPDDAWGSIDVTTLRVQRADGTAATLTQHQRFIAPDDGNVADRTVMSVALPWQVQPNEAVTIDAEWNAKVPRTFARTGYIADYYLVGHWFPKLGVLEDAGWNTHQFHSATEFYADYGVYDVRITVPKAFVVGASGREIDRTDNADGMATHRYRGEDIHDFAWTASPDFVDVRSTFEHPTLPRVEMRLLLQPEHEGQESRHFDAAAAMLKYFGEWFGAYPFDHFTIVDPAFQSRSGGMEYPALITAGTRWLAPRTVADPEAVTIHEAGHQIWHTVVGTNEFEHAWMDEGLTTFSTARVMDEIRLPNRLALRFFRGFIPWVIDDIQLKRETDENRLSGYRRNAEAEVPARPTFAFWPGTSGAITYNKTALWLHTLERHLGWPVLQRIMSTYFDRWKFRHPQPADFFAVVSEVANQDMTWFFDEVYRSSNVFDYGVQRLTSTRAKVRVKADTTTAAAATAGLKPDITGGEPAAETDGYRTIVVVRRDGEAIFPIDVETTFRDGERVLERWDGRDRNAVFTYERRSQALSVQVDPQRVLLLDVNYTNNSATLEPRAGEAALKWALKWLVWLQQLLLTYAFFV
jgi:aminopeptidase N